MSSNDRTTEGSAGLEALEPRSLLSAYLYHSPAEIFGVDTPMHDLAAPGNDILGFGAAVAGLGDIDGDGFGDFAVSSTGAPPEGGSIFAGQPGHVFVYSGHTASLIRTLDDGAWEFGASMVSVGDLDDDGVPDLLVGSPRFDATDNGVADPTGRVYVFSGADGGILLTIDGATPFTDFGRVVSGLNDADDDGVADLIIGAPGTTADLAGSIFIYSGADGSLIRSIDGEGAGDRFGAAIAVASGDVVDHDLFAVGAPFNDAAFTDAGRVYVYRSDGTSVLNADGLAAGEEFGAALAIARVVTPGNPPGILHRLIVGAPGSDVGINDENPMHDRGRLHSLDLATGVDRTISQADDGAPNARYGARIASIENFGAPGSENLVILAPGVGRAYTVSPYLEAFRSMGLDTVPTPVTPQVLGFAIAGAGDVNNDGIADIISSDGAGRVTIVSTLAVGAPIIITGASADARFMWSEFPGGLPMLLVDGVARSYSHVPGLSLASVLDSHLPTSHILAIGNDGTIVFVNRYADGTPDTELLVDTAGQVVTLHSLVTTVEGEEPADFGSLGVVRISSGGHILLTERTAQFPITAGRTWIFSGGTLSFLWTGFAFDVNASGVVVGQRRQAGLPDQAVRWSHDVGITVIPGLEGTLLISDSGDVIGTRVGTRSASTPGTISRWSGGVITDIAAGPSLGGLAVSQYWLMRAIDAAGRIIGDVYTQNMLEAPSLTTYVFQPGDGLRTIVDATHRIQGFDFGRYAVFGLDTTAPTRLTDDGRILTSNGILTPIADREIAVLRTGSPTPSITVTGQGRYVAAINQYDELMLFHYQGATWTLRRMVTTLVTDAAELVVFTDGHTSDSAFVALADQGDLRLLPFVYNGGFEYFSITNGGQGRTPIVQKLTTFTNAVGIVHLVGIDPSGDLVIYYRNTTPYAGDVSAWNYANLSQDHLAPQGLATPAFVSHFTTYSTSWSGMNIAGLDAQGHVQVVWWAPGLSLWRADDLSAAAGPADATFRGEISAFVTPWNTLHVNGVLDSTGGVAALWWVPGFGSGWRVDELGPGGLSLVTDSITALVTPWGGLSVAGRDATTGQVDVYWWSPTSGQWASEPLLHAGNPAMSGRLDSYVEVAGGTGGVVTQSILGHAEDGSLLRASWRPADAAWSLENLTDLA